MHPYLPLSLADVMETNAERFCDAPAYEFEGKTLTHGQLLRRGRQLASALHLSGVRRQDRVAVLAMNSLEIVETMAAAQCSGIIVATVNFRLAPPEFRYILNDAAPTALVFEAQYLPVIEKLRAELPTIKTFICVGGKADWAQEYEAFMATGTPEGPPFRATEEDVYCVIYTSGTTGKPKGCVWSHRGMRTLGQYMSCEMRLGSTDKALIVMPMFHMGGISIALGLHFRGGGVVLHRQYEPGEALATVERERPTVLHFAPPLIQMLLDHPKAATVDFSSVRTVVYSAAPMPTPLLRRAVKLFGQIFINMYGQSEVMSSGLARELHFPDGTERERNWLASVGHPYPNTLIRIVDDEGRDCPVGQPGEIVVKTAAMFSGYWNNSVGTLETIRDGWCHSGDIGKFDEDGMLYLVDRKKDMIISGGENIYSREVEEAVVQHPAVSECAVIGLADPKWGESVCAIVTLKSDQKPTEQEIIDHVRTLIAGYKKPKRVVFVKEIPKLATGKFNKIELRGLYAKEFQ